MTISSASLENSLINQAMAMNGDDFQLKWATAVMRQAQDQQKVMTDGLLKMIRSAPSLEGAGQLVDVSA